LDDYKEDYFGANPWKKKFLMTISKQ